MYQITNVGAARGGEAFLLVNDTGTALIDTGFAFSAEAMIRRAQSLLAGRKLDAILLTHSHYDHVSGVPYCREVWPDVKVYAAGYAKRVFDRSGALRTIRELNDNAAALSGQPDYRWPAEGLYVDVPLADGDYVTVGNMRFQVVETPGHTMDCISFWCEEESLLLASETLGYPLLPEKVSPTFLVGYQLTLDSIRRQRELNPRHLLVSHKGVVDRPFIVEFLEKAELWSIRCKELILDGHARGLDTAGLIQLLKDTFYCGEILELQPEKAFYLNAGYTVALLLRECGDPT